MDETFEEFSKWYLKKFPSASGETMVEIFNARKSYKNGIRYLIKEELIKYGLIDKNGKRLGVQYNAS